MSVTSVGSGTSTDLAALQKQLAADQAALLADETKKTSAATVAAAALKVETDEQAIAQAGKVSGASATSATPANSTGQSVDVTA
jgi:hypothetical protein